MRVTREIPTVEEVIGQNVRAFRERLGLTGTQFGKAMAPVTGGAGWSRQTVSKAESGKREFSPLELLAMAYVLEVTLPQLFDTLDPIRVPGGGTLSGDVVGALTTARVDDQERMLRVLQSVRALRVARQDLSLFAGALETELAHLERAAAGAHGVVEGGVRSRVAGLGHAFEAQAKSWRERAAKRPTLKELD